MAKSEIKLGAERTIKTADFEGLRVHAEVNEIIEWKDEKEREKKLSEVVKHLKSDFVKSYTMMIDTLGVKRSLGTGQLKKEDGSVHNANVTTEDNEIDMFGD